SNGGDGSWTLSWTVPPGATEYWIKYSDRTIVPWLNYDRYQQTYEKDPAANVAFFAAENVPNEPAPGTPGTTQSFAVRGLDPAKSYDFKARWFSGPKQLPSSLHATVTAPARASQGDSFSYHVEIQNTATASIADVRASALLSSVVQASASNVSPPCM